MSFHLNPCVGERTVTRQHIGILSSWSTDGLEKQLRNLVGSLYEAAVMGKPMETFHHEPDGLVHAVGLLGFPEFPIARDAAIPQST